MATDHSRRGWILHQCLVGRLFVMAPLVCCYATINGHRSWYRRSEGSASSSRPKRPTTGEPGLGFGAGAGNAPTRNGTGTAVGPIGPTGGGYRIAARERRVWHSARARGIGSSRCGDDGPHAGTPAWLTCPATPACATPVQFGWETRLPRAACYRRWLLPSPERTLRGP